MSTDTKKTHVKPKLQKFKPKPREEFGEDCWSLGTFVCTKCGKIMREHDYELYHGYRISKKLFEDDPVAYVKALKKEQAKPSCEHAGKTFRVRELPPFIMPFMRKRDRRKLKQISKI